MIYKFAPGFRLKAKPEVVGKHLEFIQKKHGELTPQIVVEDARKANSPIHEEFDWDDKVAAEKWRNDQALYVLRSVVAVVTNEAGEERVVRAFINLEPGKGFHDIKTVITNPKMTEQLLDKALRELRAWHTKYEIYKELAHLCQVVDRNLLPFEEKLTNYQIDKITSSYKAQA